MMDEVRFEMRLLKRSLFLTAIIILLGIVIYFIFNKFFFINSSDNNNYYSKYYLKENIEENANKLQSTMVIMIPGFFWVDFDELEISEDLPNFNKIINEGAIGLLNTTINGPYHYASSYLSLGSGVRSIAGEESGTVLSHDEKYYGKDAKTVYKRHTGYDLDQDLINSSDSISDICLAVQYPKLLTKNQGLGYEVPIGRLGNMLEDRGIYRYYHGNADTSISRRYGALIAMNNKGIVSNGILTPPKTLKEKEMFPFGYKTDYGKTYDMIVRYLDYHRDKKGAEEPFLYLLELGDGLRIDEYRERLKPGVKYSLQKKTLKNIDHLLGRINQLKEKNNLQIIILNPAPSHKDYQEGKRLTPIVISPVKSGEKLISSTTRREGLVSNFDFLPTILNNFDRETPNNVKNNIKGNVIETTEVKNNATGLTKEKANMINLSTINELIHYEKELVNIYNIRPPILKGYIIIQVIIMAMGLFAVIGRLKIPYIKFLLYAMLISPLAFVMTPYLSLSSLWGTIMFLVVFSLFSIGVIGKITERTMKKLCVICLLTSIAILLPFVLGSENIIYRGLLSHDAISGARYYGLGNELMGVLTGSFTIGLFSLYNIKPLWKKSYYLLGVLLVLFFLHPGFGANFGGAVSALIVFFSILYLFFVDFSQKGCIQKNNQKEMIKRILIVIGFLVVFLGSFLIFNLLLEEVSHLGRALRLALNNGPKELIPIIKRKITMNLTLLRYSNWSFVLLSFLAVLFLKYLKFSTVMDNFNKNYPLLKTGMLGIVFGGITAFFSNDSGVIAAATMFLYVSVPMLILGIEEKEMIYYNEFTNIP